MVRGSVGRTIASDQEVCRFESHHRQIFVLNIYLPIYNCRYCKDENKENEAGNGPFKKRSDSRSFYV